MTLTKNAPPALPAAAAASADSTAELPQEEHGDSRAPDDTAGSTWRFTAESTARRAALESAMRAASFEAAILLLGESGCGKSLLAHDIHEHSHRARGPFVEVNCSAIPHELFESEVFGHVRGAFTGAQQARRGLVEQAEGGTLFLDEVGDLPAPAQAKLLTFLDHGRYFPVGSSTKRQADVRLIAATNRDLRAMVQDRFRADLYHRIAGISIWIPEPAASDVRAATAGLLLEIAARNHMTVTRQEIEQITELAGQHRPAGQFRGLRNLLTRFLFYRDSRRTIDDAWCMAIGDSTGLLAAELLSTDARDTAELPHPARLERLLRLQLMRRASDVQALASRIGCTAATIYNWLTKEGLTSDDLGDTESLRGVIEAEVAAMGHYRPFVYRIFDV